MARTSGIAELLSKYEATQRSTIENMGKQRQEPSESDGRMAAQRTAPEPRTMLQRMEDDGTCVRELFQDHLPSTRLMKSQGLQVIDAVVEMAKSDSVDSFVINYRLVLEVQSECSPVLVEKLLTAREDITNRDAADVMAQCREAFQEKNPGNQKGGLKTPGTVKRRRRWGSMVIS